MRPRHVLVIDDDPDVCAVLHAALEEIGGYRVTSAATGDAALPILDGDRPDLVVLDALGTGMSAMEFALHATQRDIPLILVTGDPDSPARLGFPCLLKPFRSDRLLAQCAAAIAKSQDNLSIMRAALARLLKDRDELRRLLGQGRRSQQRIDAALAPFADKKLVAPGRLDDRR
jgi:DNA-binding NtrC family response regulator